MIRTLRFSRLAVAVAPFAAMFAVACGGSDTIPDEDGAADATPLDVDGASVDGEVQDGTLNDTGGDGPTSDGAFDDVDVNVDGGMDGTIDGAVIDAGPDATVTDGAIVDGKSDAKDADDAGDSSDASHHPDASDASDASDAADAEDAEDASDASDASLGASILGSAAEFAVFSGATVTNATATVTTITGDLGTYPSSTAIGPTPPVMIGAEHLGDGVAQIAATDILAAYDKLLPGNLPCGTNMTGLDLGGRTLVPGVYCFDSTAGLTGTLTLNAQNNPDARWVFQVGSALTTASGSAIVLINGTAGQVCNSYWQITSSATLGTNSIFGGNILALAAVTITTGTSVIGRTFGITGEVSTDTNVLGIGACAGFVPPLDAGLPDASLLDASGPDAADAGDAD